MRALGVDDEGRVDEHFDRLERADQPTTEPSTVDLLAKHALLWAERWTEDIEPNFTDHWPPEEVAEMNQEVRDVAAPTPCSPLSPPPLARSMGLTGRAQQG